MAEKTVIDEMLEKARIAQAEIENYTQEQVDALVKIIGKTIYDHRAFSRGGGRRDTLRESGQQDL